MIKFIKNNIVVTLIILIATGLVYYFFTRETTLDIKDKSYCSFKIVPIILFTAKNI